MLWSRPIATTGTSFSVWSQSTSVVRGDRNEYQVKFLWCSLGPLRFTTPHWKQPMSWFNHNLIQFTIYLPYLVAYHSFLDFSILAHVHQPKHKHTRLWSLQRTSNRFPYPLMTSRCWCQLFVVSCSICLPLMLAPLISMLSHVHVITSSIIPTTI